MFFGLFALVVLSHVPRLFFFRQRDGLFIGFVAPGSVERVSAASPNLVKSGRRTW